MLDSVIAELLDSLEEKRRMTEEILEDIRRAQQGKPPLYDRPDPDDPEGKFAFIVEGKRDIALLERVMASAAADRPRYAAMLYEMAFMYLVSIFDAFLQDLFTTALIARPETLRSRKQITYEKVLELQRRGNLIAYLAEREMMEVGYRPINEQLEFYAQKFGVQLTDSGVRLGDLNEMFARRNLLAHNNGYVNTIYRERAPRSRLMIGKRLSVSDNYWKRSRQLLDTVATYAAKRLTEKLA